MSRAGCAPSAPASRWWWSAISPSVAPAGPLREPLGRLPQPDAVVMNGAPEHASLGAALRGSPALEMRLVAQQAVRLDAQGPPRALHGFSGQRVHGVAGIGNPARFFRE